MVFCGVFVQKWCSLGDRDEVSIQNKASVCGGNVTARQGCCQNCRGSSQIRIGHKLFCIMLQNCWQKKEQRENLSPKECQLSFNRQIVCFSTAKTTPCHDVCFALLPPCFKGSFKKYCICDIEHMLGRPQASCFESTVIQPLTHNCFLHLSWYFTQNCTLDSSIIASHFCYIAKVRIGCNLAGEHVNRWMMGGGCGLLANSPTPNPRAITGGFFQAIFVFVFVFCLPSSQH